MKAILAIAFLALISCVFGDGINGRDGKNGNNGINGKDGVDGKDGKNWKECAWQSINDHKDIGVIKNCAFKKHSSKTWLKVVVSSNMRITRCDNCGSRWYVTFDDKECSAPVPIDVAVYMAQGAGKNLHRPRIITGHCHIPHAKTIKVEFRVGKCHGGIPGSDALTGWNSSTRIFIEEVEAPQQ